MCPNAESTATDAGARAPGIVVLGMHRSGTSALAGCLSALGARLGARLLEPAADNAKGYFENADAVRIDETLLASIGRTWDDVRALPDDWLSAEPARIAVDEASALLADDLAAGGCWALKDPRICLLLPVWREAWARLSTEPLRAILMLRHPYEVVRSLQQRDRMPAMSALLLWFRHLFAAVRHSEGMPRAWMSYDQLLEDPVRVFSRVGDTLGVHWPTPPSHADAAFRRFLSADERHHRAGALPEALPPELAGIAVALHNGLVDARDAEDFARRSALGVLRFEAWLDAHSDELQALEHQQAMVSAAMAAATLAWLRQRRVLETRIAALDDALGAATGLAQARLEDMVDLDRAYRQAASIAAAHADALREAADVRDRIETLATERLERMETLERRIGDIGAMAESRLAEIQALDARLVATDAALAHARHLVAERERAFAEADRALGQTQALVSQKDAALQATAVDLVSMEADLASTRADLASTQADLVSVQADLASTQAQLEAATDRHTALMARPLVRIALRIDALWQRLHPRRHIGQEAGPP